MATLRVTLNRKGVRALLRSAEVLADLERRANQIAAVAGEGFSVEGEVGPARARAAVITSTVEAAREEAEHRTLTRAVDAGRI